MAVALPPYIALKSHINKKYLRYKNESSAANSETLDFLQVSGENVMSPFAKYQVVAAAIGKGLVHIRCCYNNKFWRRINKSNFWIVAGGDKPDEDQSQWSCTLFEPLPVNGNPKLVRLRHVELGRYLLVHTHPEPSYNSCLFANSATEFNPQLDVFAVIDWGLLLVLPKHVAFKGDNGNYLTVQSMNGRPYLQFVSTTKADPTTWFEVSSDGDGRAQITCHENKQLWKRDSDNWIWADSSVAKDDADTFFWPVKVDKNVVALRVFGGNNYFIKRYTIGGFTHCLNAATPTITQYACLEVEELVLTRTIYDVKFRLSEATIYAESTLTMATGKAVNNTSEPDTVEFKLTYTVSRSFTFEASRSMTFGVSSTASFGIPEVFGGGVTISADWTREFRFGETVSSENTMETTYTVVVPPMTSVSVSLLATRASCEVPFSYYQRDLLYNGETVIYLKDDGVYHGTNSFNFRYEAQQTSLPKSGPTQDLMLASPDKNGLLLSHESDHDQENGFLLPIYETIVEPKTTHHLVPSKSTKHKKALQTKYNILSNKLSN